MYHALNQKISGFTLLSFSQFYHLLAPYEVTESRPHEYGNLRYRALAVSRGVLLLLFARGDQGQKNLFKGSKTTSFRQ